MDPKTAEEWDFCGRVPVANEDMGEGLKYFYLHSFHFYEDGGYSQVGDYAGYQELEGGVSAWRSLMERWETECAPLFPEWTGRYDMRVVSKVRRAAGDGGSSEFMEGDILPCYAHPFACWKTRRSPHEIDWPKFRENVEYFREKIAQGQHDPDRMPRIGEFTDAKYLACRRTRLRTLTFTQPMEATLGHNLMGDIYEVPVPRAQLAVWLETELDQGELAWRWVGSVYTWRGCMMYPLYRCDAQTQTNIIRMVHPLMRQWGQLLRDVQRTQSAMVANSLAAFRPPAPSSAEAARPSADTSSNNGNSNRGSSSSILGNDMEV